MDRILMKRQREHTRDRKSGSELFRFFGALRGETEYGRIGKGLQRRWKP